MAGFIIAGSIFLVFIIAVGVGIHFANKGAQKTRMAMESQWEGIVVSVTFSDYKPRQAQAGIDSWAGGETLLLIKVSYQRDDGGQGDFSVLEGTANGYGRKISSTAALPPEYLFDEIQAKWDEGSRIIKLSGQYYPQLVIDGADA